MVIGWKVNVLGSLALAGLGWRLAELGWRLAGLGWRLAELGWRLAELGWCLAGLGLVPRRARAGASQGEGVRTTVGGMGKGPGRFPGQAPWRACFRLRLVQQRLDHLGEAGACAVEAALHRAQVHAGDLGDLFVALPLQLPQAEHQLVMLR
jgi:hypothetical protein